MVDIESEYRARMDALDGRARVARAIGLLNWTCEILARQIVAEKGEMPAARLKWEVALRLYGADERTRELIERRLADVSG